MEVLASARLSFRRCTAIASSGLIAALVVLGALWPSVAGAGAGAPAGAAAACARSATRPRNRWFSADSCANRAACCRYAQLSAIQPVIAINFDAQFDVRLGLFVSTPETPFANALDQRS